MEAILRNVPKDLTSDTLEDALMDHMKKLGIQEFGCEKPRRRTMAWVQFLNPADGTKFLRKYEKISHQPSANDENAAPGHFGKPKKLKDIARLHLLKTPIYVSRSNRKDEDQMMDQMISHLELKRDKKAERSKKNKTPKVPATPVPIVSIACGQTIFDGPEKTFTFVQRTGIPRLENAHITFGNQAVKIVLSSQFEKVHIEFYNRTIHDLLIDEQSLAIALVIIEAPRMYQQVVDPESNTRYLRIRSIPFWNSHIDNVKTCMVYRVTLQNKTDVRLCARLLGQHDSLTRIERHLPVKQSHQHPDNRESFTLIGQTFLKKEKLPFALIFQVEALVWNGYLQPGEAKDLLQLMDRVAMDSIKNKVAFPVTAHAMKQLFYRVPVAVSPGTDPSCYDFIELLSEVIEAEFEARAENPHRDRIYGSRISPNQTWVFKAMVTPTRILLSGPEAENKNRVLRMFPNHSDYFLRVSFYDEDGQDLFLKPQVSNDNVFKRYKNILQRGIIIASRKYEFLGFSHSSLRSHSVWFVAPFVDDSGNRQNCTSILNSLGDFKHIQVPAKCAARMGQAFSETPYAVKLDECGIEISYIPDVKYEDRIFSDGVGTISSEALSEIWPHLPIEAGTPTCLQIRLVGFKGMLSLDTRLDGKKICLREESMMKFPGGGLDELGICDTSCKPLQLMLNRQIIKILEDMGTNKEWFFEMQNQALDVLRNVTAHINNTKDFLERQDTATNIGFPKFIAQLFRMDIDHRRDKFMKSVVEHVVLRELRLLKHKARIPVDRGVTLFGVMDETGFLNEGEVYVTYDKTWARAGRRVNGTLTDGRIIITRSPALHPGDVRVVRQVTPPRGHDLLNLQNCVVFSQKGKRDLPSQLSGGDLDGDIYNVIWDSAAMPIRMFGPADYPRVTPQSLGRPVTRTDIADFFIDFMKTDLLGMIATRHVILADVKEKGTIDEQCLKLAALHSTAVDFSKTGIPVDFRQIPRSPPFRPDFLAAAPPLSMADAGQIDHILDSDDDEDADHILAGGKHKFYRSEKVLGHLYRNVDEKKIWHENIKIGIATAGPSVWDQLLTAVEAKVKEYDLDIDWNRKSEEAWKLRNHYDASIEGLRKDFSENPKTWLTEVEVFCGFILNKRGGQTRRQRDSSIKLKEEVDGALTWIVKNMRGLGKDTDVESVQSGVGRGREAAVELCWACLAIGCIKSPASPLYYGSAKLESFRVVAACCLVKELNILAKHMEVASGGGFVGVGRGQRRGRGGSSGRNMTLPLR
ncbi:RNA dependent RNA polymerase-domain-containing protein [Mariannaea sp. PMI_226]|nr:RNA dependent RNA polymerase-domain-containing protein [Mariannaea sp. PMI_226]